MNTNSITFRLNGVFLVIVTTLFLCVGLFNYYKIKAERETAMERQVQGALQRLAISLPNAIWNFDDMQIQQIVQAEMSASFIRAILVLNGQKVVGGVARKADASLQRVTQVEGSGPASSVELAQQENSQRKVFGKATVYVSRDELNDALQQDLWLLALQIVAQAAILLFAMWQGLARIVLRPLARLSLAIHNIATGEADLTKRLPIGAGSEFDDVTEGFNTFIARLQAIIDSVQVGAVSLANASNELASGTFDLAERTESQAHSLEQTRHSMETLTQTVAHNAQNAREANGLAESAATVAVKGGAVVSKVVHTMDAINDSSKKIVDIISVIDAIAFQTNILALNAAVEAARAGEEGRGFAVVASEVRNLAQRSASAAKEIKALITSSVETVQAGNQLVSNAGKTMDEIVGSINGVAAIIAKVVVASDAQSKDISQINQAMITMDRMTQENSALVEEATAATESMRSQTGSLSDAVSVFKVA